MKDGKILEAEYTMANGKAQKLKVQTKPFIAQVWMVLFVGIITAMLAWGALSAFNAALNPLIEIIQKVGDATGLTD